MERGGDNLVCSKCGSNNVDVQAVTRVKSKKRSFLYWIFIGCWLEPIMWLIFTLPWLIIKIFKPKKITSITYKMAICQSCGHSWKVK